MKRLLTTALLATMFVSGMACAADVTIPWAANSGGTESTHIAAMGGSECAASVGDEDE